MSYHPQPITPIPDETSRVARAAFPKGTLAMDLRDALAGLYTDQDFADLFAARGQGAECPWRLAVDGYHPLAKCTPPHPGRCPAPSRCGRHSRRRCGSGV